MAGFTTLLNRSCAFAPLVAKPRVGPLKERKVYRVSRLSPPILFGIHNNNLENLRRGLAERVFSVEMPGGFQQPPKPAAGVFEERLAYFRSELLAHVPVSTPIPLDSFPGLYEGRRRTVYQNAVDSLYARPVERRDAELTTFVKAEKLNLEKKPDPAPRVIQPRTPRYNSCVGVYLKPLEAKVCKGIAEVFGETTVMKGLNSAEQGELMSRKWNKFKRPVAVGLDAKRFDQHVSVDALKFEHSCYLGCFPAFYRKELRKLLSWQLVNKGKGVASDGTIPYQVDGCRMSGDMNTSLGNCLLMCSMVHAYMRHCGISRYELCNNGDDCTVIFEQSELDRFMTGLVAWFLDMGFQMEVETPVYDLEGIEFCQTHPIWTPDGWIMCRNDAVARAKDCVSLIPWSSEKMFKSWCKSVGQCGLSLAGGVPIFQEFYASLVRSGVGARAVAGQDRLKSGMQILAERMSRSYGDVHPRTRYSYWLAFGVTPDMQCALEAIYSGITQEYGTPDPTCKHHQCLQDYTRNSS